jgi:hypothetical protein
MAEAEELTNFDVFGEDYLDGEDEDDGVEEQYNAEHTLQEKKRILGRGFSCIQTCLC